MPWAGQIVMDPRLCFVTAYRRGESPLPALRAVWNQPEDGLQMAGAA